MARFSVCDRCWAGRVWGRLCGRWRALAGCVWGGCLAGWAGGCLGGSGVGVFPVSPSCVRPWADQASRILDLCIFNSVSYRVRPLFIISVSLRYLSLSSRLGLSFVMLFYLSRISLFNHYFAIVSLMVLCFRLCVSFSCVPCLCSCLPAPDETRQGAFTKLEV